MRIGNDFKGHEMKSNFDLNKSEFDAVMEVKRAHFKSELNLFFFDVNFFLNNGVE